MINVVHKRSTCVLQCVSVLHMWHQNECAYIVAPSEKMAEVLRKTTKEAKDMISKARKQHILSFASSFMSSDDTYSITSTLPSENTKML